jgi:NNP family nitrate/nitrite transporter-like MFS transporter
MVGLAVAAPLLSGSLLRIPFSAWVDSNGGRLPFLVLLTMSIVGMSGLLMLFDSIQRAHLTASYFPVLLALGILSGCGIATFSVGIGQVSYWFPHKAQGWALGTYAGLGNLAPGIFSLLLPIAVPALGISGAYRVWLAFLIFGTLTYALVGKNAWYFQLRNRGVNPADARRIAGARGQEIFPKGKALQGLLLSAGRRKTWVLVALYFTTFGGFLALTAWFPTYWGSYFNLSLKTAGAMTALFSIAASLVRVAGGAWSDRFGGERTATLALITLLAGALIMTVSTSIGLSVAAELLIAAGMGVNNAAVFKLVPKYVPDAVGGTAGWVGGIGAFGGFVVPPTMGMFVGHWGTAGYARGFLVFVALSIACLILTAALTRDSVRTAGQPSELKLARTA